MQRNKVNMFSRLHGKALAAMHALFAIQNFGVNMIGQQNQYGSACYYSNTSSGTAQRKRRKLASKTGR